jgi:hypothetical protein
MRIFCINLKFESMPDIQKFIACEPILTRSVTCFVVKFVSINTQVLPLEKYVRTLLLVNIK